MAKEIWGTLREIFEGEVSVQRSRLALLKTEVNMFVRKDGETADQVFRRLKSIILDLRNYGCTWADDNFIKDKFMYAMILTDDTMVTMIHQRMDFDQLTPNQIVSSFTTNSLLKAKSKQTHDLVQGINITNNLALKAKKTTSPPRLWRWKKWKNIVKMMMFPRARKMTLKNLVPLGQEVYGHHGYQRNKLQG